MPDTERTVFLVSGGTGITADAMCQSLLSQFPGIAFRQIALPYIHTAEQAHSAVATISDMAREEGVRPLVFASLVNKQHREILKNCQALVLDVFEEFLGPVEAELGTAVIAAGKSHAIRDPEAYRIRIDAVHFALDNDDSIQQQLDKADIILLGVSRSGKTPTSIYLALQFGLYTANYRMTLDELATAQLPEALTPYRERLFGLSIDPARLALIRAEHMPEPDYAAVEQCEREITALETFCDRHRIPYFRTTDMSVEEISSRILASSGAQRRLQ